MAAPEAAPAGHRGAADPAVTVSCLVSRPPFRGGGEHPGAERRNGGSTEYQSQAPGVAHGHERGAEDDQHQRGREPEDQEGVPDGPDVLPGPDEGALAERALAQGGAPGSG